MDMWYTIGVITQSVLALIALYILIKDGTKPIRIWAWILVIVLIPFFGIILYVFFGVNLRKKKLFDIKKAIDYEKLETYAHRFKAEAEEKLAQRNDITSKYRHLISLLTNVNNSILSFNNKATILNDGPDTFESIFQACEKAEEYIHLQ